MSLGMLIVGVIIAVIGYCLQIYTSGILSTLGRILVIVGVIIAIIGLILLVVGLAGISLAILPAIMLA